jgi:hypothetical protein
MGDALLPFPLTERGAVAGALDGKSPANRSHPGGPSSRANRLQPVHPA